MDKSKNCTKYRTICKLSETERSKIAKVLLEEQQQKQEREVLLKQKEQLESELQNVNEKMAMWNLKMTDDDFVPNIPNTTIEENESQKSDSESITTHDQRKPTFINWFLSCLVLVIIIFAICWKKSDDGSHLQGNNGDNDENIFVVGFDASYEPYVYIDENNEYTGFDLELAKAFCELQGWKLVKHPIDWENSHQSLENGEIDCFWSGFTMNRREDYYTFSIPYADHSLVFVTSEKSGIDSLDDLAQKTVGVQAESAALKVLQIHGGNNYPKLTDTFESLVEFTDYNIAFAGLQIGTIDALVIEIGIAKQKVASYGTEFVILDEFLTQEQYAIGLQKGNQALCDKINKGLQLLANDGTVDELARKYGIADMIILKAD